MTPTEKILSLIQSSIDDFNGAIPGLQKQMYDDLLTELQRLKTREGSILANVENLRLIGTIRNKLEKIILSEEYLGKVAAYIEAFDLVSTLHLSYFHQFNSKYKPRRTLAIVRDLAVESTLNSLTEAGINANVLEPVAELLRTNITTGGSIAALHEGLRSRVLTDGENLGSLERYTKQITTDALNQYSAQYHQTVAEDLGFEWFRYVGSNLETTREFCEWLTKKDYVHKSELAEVLHGKIDGHQCRIYPKTGLPYGMVPETNVSNFQVYRGGFKCGHQAMAVPAAAVPKEVKEKVKRTI